MSQYPTDNKHNSEGTSSFQPSGHPNHPFPTPGYPIQTTLPAGQQPPIYSQSQQREQSINGQSGVFIYSIMYRDTNTMLRVDIPKGHYIKSKGGSMVAMSPTIRLEGKFKRGFKLFASGDMMYTSATANDADGYIYLAPPILGDIIPIHLEGGRSFIVSKHSYLAHTSGVQLSVKSQGITKGLFSGEGLFTIKASGEGVIFVSSLGAIHTVELQNNEEIIIDNGHLVAWDHAVNYKIEKAAGFIASLTTGEGLVCRFKGPGRVYMQTRNPEEFSSWVQGFASSS
ncbi:DUF124-domain-containing protein [Basidiobolus meristosporus CBS 931.73]|uniref:Altered inheritance of mitochondria protein 24, mitochondrial n=1 Tax=Basidiobolus meristosporus CBS 931.73 TaxID=1314790 RepID=A0A1Y1YH66_9FUNG|nr:DUF124-domain-containing protein [Basidiobolus meristosporus CBS 931.73]|eukprot:ORX97381.1 DUF124-domain-containing protein [Basidiobolus meristosporus CBS 931.73]